MTHTQEKIAISKGSPDIVFINKEVKVDKSDFIKTENFRSLKVNHSLAETNAIL